MNEQLIGDLFAEATSRMTSSSSREFSQKFAELIVRECIERVRLQYIPVRDQLVRTEREQGIVECGVASVIALEELVQESTDKWYKENILGDEE
jgi:hypothetical protein